MVYSITEMVEVVYIYGAEQCDRAAASVFNQRHPNNDMEHKYVRELVKKFEATESVRTRKGMLIRVSREEYALNKIYFFKQLEENLDESTIVYILAGQFEEELYNKCERDRKRLDGNKYYNRSHYNNYQYGKYNHGGQERDNYNYTRGPFHGNQFYHNKNNINQRFQDNRRWNNYKNGQYKNTYRSREQTWEGRNDGSFKRYKNENESNRSGNKEEKEPEKHMGKEININNVNIKIDAENDNPIGENGIKEEMSDKDKYCIRNNRYKENYEEKKA
ncbi:hypothetical protein FQA39_LY11643 [Lamprigera yunnana]|nr:hypothetical protein FQA39_LY11643 [Lamprigera yunnana]